MDINNINICEATPKDLKALSLIEQQLSNRILSDSSIIEMLSSQSSTIFVAKHLNNIIGYIAFDILVDHIDICSIAVSSDHQRLKIGSKLLAHLKSFALSKDILDVFLEVRASNLSAIKFYEKNGFQKISIRKNYYKDNLEDAIIYKQELG